jgi:hypothetical protein
VPIPVASSAASTKVTAGNTAGPMPETSASQPRPLTKPPTCRVAANIPAHSQATIAVTATRCAMPAKIALA